MTYTTDFDSEEKFHDIEYFKLIKNVVQRGINKTDRTGTGTISLPFQQMRFDLTNNSIPLLTSKKMHIRSIIYEILWYLRGDTNIKYLQDHNVRIWNDWADENGDLGPIYGAMWRKWPGKVHSTINYNTDPPSINNEQETIDQVANAIELLKHNPTDRRIIINAWNPTFLPDDTKSFSENVALGNQALPPCHAFIQFWSDGTRLMSHLYQRSCDVGLGVPFNIVQYSILTHMIAQVTGLIATEFVWTGGDVHIYNNHLDALITQLDFTRLPPSPTLRLNPNVKDIDSFKYEDFEIIGYDGDYPKIQMKVSV